MNFFFEDIGEGKPIVLIHGFPLSGKMWEFQSQSLVKNGFRVILPDLPGFGKNNFTYHYSIQEMAKQIGELLELLEIDKAIIGGLSMGGYVSLNLFRLMPEKFAALMLFDTTHLADNDEKRNSRFSLISKIEDQGPIALVEYMLPNLISDYTKQTNLSLTNELKEIFSKVNSVAAINALRSMAERNDSSDVVRKITVPTLLIFGEFDKVTNLDNAGIMNKMITNSSLVIIENAGHFSNLEQPEQFNEALLKFCNRIEF